MIITVGNVKGGCGKTTLATNLAVLSAINKKKTLLIDCDVQGSTMDWRNCRSDELAHIQSVAINKPTVHKDVKNFEGFENIFIDAGGRGNDTFRSSIMACDLFLIPLTPSSYDIWASEDTLKMLNQARVYKDIKSMMIINQVILNTNLSKEVKPLLEDFSKEYGVNIAETTLGARQDFKKCVGEGKGVSEFSPHSKADTEIQNLFEEIFKYGNSKKTKEKN